MSIHKKGWNVADKFSQPQILLCRQHWLHFHGVRNGLGTTIQVNPQANYANTEHDLYRRTNLLWGIRWICGMLWTAYEVGHRLSISLRAIASATADGCILLFPPPIGIKNIVPSFVDGQVSAHCKIVGALSSKRSPYCDCRGSNTLNVSAYNLFVASRAGFRTGYI